MMMNISEPHSNAQSHMALRGNNFCCFSKIVGNLAVLPHHLFNNHMNMNVVVFNVTDDLINVIYLILCW